MVYIEVPGWECAMESSDKVASLCMHSIFAVPDHPLQLIEGLHEMPEFSFPQHCRV